MTERVELFLPHRFSPGDPDAPVLLLLHGTGGDENDLLPLGSLLDPAAGVLSPRGPVRENGAARWFRRLAEGVFDHADVIRRAHQLADFVLAARRAYDLGDRSIVAVGFSNGANIAAATVLLRPQVVHDAILFAAMSPLADPPDVDLSAARVFLSMGENDPMAPLESANRLVAILRERRADVTVHRHPRGHGIAADDVAAARSRLRSWRGRPESHAPPPGGNPPADPPPSPHRRVRTHVCGRPPPPEPGDRNSSPGSAIHSRTCRRAGPRAARDSLTRRGVAAARGGPMIGVRRDAQRAAFAVAGPGTRRALPGRIERWLWDVRRLMVALGALGGLVIAFVAGALPASGDATPTPAQCDRVLIDGAGILSAAEAEQVSEAAQTFRSETSFEIRIRILTQDQAPTLEAWIDDHQRACDSWASAGGGFRTNLVVLAFTTDTAEQSGETWLAYGDQMPATMDDRWDDVQRDTINPALRDGDSVRGITDGLDEIRATIDPPPSPVWFWLLGITVLIAVIVVVRWLLRRRRYRRHLVESFAEVTTEVDEQTMQLDGLLTTVHRDLELVRSTFAADEAEAVLGSAPGLVADGDRLIHDRSELSNQRDLVASGRDLPALAAALDAWKALAKRAKRLIPELRAEELRLTAALNAAQGVSERLGEVPELVTAVRAAADAGTRDGFVVADDVAVLDTVDERVVTVERLVAERRLLAADAELTELLADLTSARDALGSLHQRRAELRERLSALRTRLGDLAATGETAERAYAALADYTPGVRADLDDRPAAGREASASAHAAADDAEQALALGNLGVAERRATEADAAIGMATAAYTVVTERLDTVERLRCEVPDRAAKAERHLTALENLIATKTAARQVEGGRVGQLRTRLDALDLEVDRPDWLALDTELADIETTLESAEREAQRAIKASEARRRRLRRARQLAADDDYEAGGFWGGSWWGGGDYSHRRRRSGLFAGGFAAGRASSRSSFRSSRSSGSSSRRSFGGSSRRGGGGSRGRSGGRRGGGSRR